MISRQRIGLRAFSLGGETRTLGARYLGQNSALVGFVTNVLLTICIVPYR
jgi:hypothetical protein